MPHRASPKQATPIPPRLKRARLSGPFSVSRYGKDSVVHFDIEEQGNREEQYL